MKKWATQLGLVMIGLMLAAACQPATANPVLRMDGFDSVIQPGALPMAWSSDRGAAVEAFAALLANPSFGADNATLINELNRRTALKAIALGGLGGFDELATGLSDGAVSAIDKQRDLILLDTDAMKDVIAVLLGHPHPSTQDLAMQDPSAPLAATGDPDSDLAVTLALQADAMLDEAIAQLQNVVDLSFGGETIESTALASSFGGGGGGGGSLIPYVGGSWYGGAKNWSVGGNVGGSSGGGHHNAGNSHKGNHHSAHPAITVGGGGGNPNYPAPAIGYNGDIISGNVGTVVPLPSATWGGLIVIALLAAIRKTRLARAFLA